MGYKAPISRDRILEAALPLLADQGYAGVSLRAIGARAGLHNSSLFHHFRSKREIALASLKRVIGALLLRLEPLEEDDPPGLETLIRVLEEVGDHFAEAPQEALLVLRAIIEPPRSELLPDRRRRAAYPASVVRLFTLLWGWLERARAQGVIRPVRIQQATRSLLGIVLFEPACAPGETDRLGDQQRARRRRELAEFVRGALAPVA